MSVLFNDVQQYGPSRSYSGHKKTAVFSQWQKQLQLQQYEAACHWMAEADASGWQQDLWSKLFLFASKHVHVHCPRLPSLLASNFIVYRTCAQQFASNSTNVCMQPRNVKQLRMNIVF